MVCGQDGSGMEPMMWDKPLLESVWLYLNPWDSVRLRTASAHWNVPKKHEPHGELFFFFLKKELLVLGELVEFWPSISAETVKVCTLFGLHMMAEENALRSDRDSSPDLGEMWKCGCPKSPAFKGKEVRVVNPWSITSAMSTSSPLKSLVG